MTSFRVAITVTRPPVGAYFDGKWLESEPTTVTVTAGVQPMNARERLLLPEGIRSRAAVKVYSDDELIAADEATGRRGDRFTWEGKTWEVFAVEHRTATRLAHYKAQATLIDLPAEPF